MKLESMIAASILVAVVAFLGCEPASYKSDAESIGGGPEAREVKAATTDKAPSPAETKPSEAVEANELQDIVDTAVAAGNFSTLAAALEAGGLVQTLKSEGPFTVFAPTDAAFAKLPEGTVAQLLKEENKDQLVSILTYHVVPGEIHSSAVASLKSATSVSGDEIMISADANGVKINDATVTTTDIACTNGVIHVIDAVILPPSKESADAAHAGKALSIERVGSFETLFAAIEAAGLTETLQNDGPFTVFAPTDKAFAALPEGTFENLLKSENKEQLAAILTYHVVSGEVPSEKVVELTTAKTVNGAELTIDVEEDGVRVNGAKVLKTDIPCEVGLIHAIDKVLLP
jgi:uncharacterized surface protein with fasciclin (FAS1) repeats